MHAHSCTHAQMCMNRLLVCGASFASHPAIHMHCTFFCWTTLLVLSVTNPLLFSYMRVPWMSFYYLLYLHTRGRLAAWMSFHYLLYLILHAYTAQLINPHDGHGDFSCPCTPVLPGASLVSLARLRSPCQLYIDASYFTCPLSANDKEGIAFKHRCVIRVPMQASCYLARHQMPLCQRGKPCHSMFALLIRTNCSGVSRGCFISSIEDSRVCRPFEHPIGHHPLQAPAQRTMCDSRSRLGT